MAKEGFETKALVGQIVVTVDGVPVALTDDQKHELASKFEAVKEALPPGDKAQVDFLLALNADQLVIAEEVGVLTAEGWLPEAVVTRWRVASGSSLTNLRAAAELEIALIAVAFLAKV